METPTIRLNPKLRSHLRQQIDDAVRERTSVPARFACRGCAADTRLLTSPVAGCTTCVNRLWRRRRRAAFGNG
jgi:hypothetical protein